MNNNIENIAIIRSTNPSTLHVILSEIWDKIIIEKDLEITQEMMDLLTTRLDHRNTNAKIIKARIQIAERSK